MDGFIVATGIIATVGYLLLRAIYNTEDNWDD